MIKDRYIQIIKDVKNQYLKDEEVFIFGSCLNKEKFRDIDIGVINIKNNKNLILFKEALEKTVLPFMVDVVDFNTVEKDFQKEVFNNKILWLNQ